MFHGFDPAGCAGAHLQALFALVNIFLSRGYFSAEWIAADQADHNVREKTGFL